MEVSYIGLGVATVGSGIDIFCLLVELGLVLLVLFLLLLSLPVVLLLG